MADTLIIATAGLKEDQVADVDHLHYPRVDYLELKRILNADVLNYAVYDQARFGNTYKNIETRLRSDLYLSILGLMKSRNYSSTIALSERAGIPISGFRRVLYNKKRFLSMFTCWSERQEFAITKLNLFNSMDEIIVKCSSMYNYLIKLGAKKNKIHNITHSVDHKFFYPLPQVSQEKNLIISVGETRSRDYPSLFRAVDGLDLHLLVAASGHWYAREKNSNIESYIPKNVTLTGRLPIVQLREKYAQSQFAVLPIHDSVFSSGATAVLEAGSMGRAVIATRSRGITDHLIDGETGILVDPDDSNALRGAIQYLLAHPEEATRLGNNARQRIEEELNLDLYVEKIANLVQSSKVV